MVQRIGSFHWDRIHRGIFACVPLTSRIVIGDSAYILDQVLLPIVVKYVYTYGSMLSTDI